ncbi:MAG: hypothetical protein AAGE89_07630 [Pseudomonadota bacterium]
MNDETPKDDHWLVRPGTIRALAAIGCISLVLVVLADLYVHHKAYFGIDGTFAFGAWFGLLSSVAVVIAAIVIGVILKRPESYYDD